MIEVNLQQLSAHQDYLQQELHIVTEIEERLKLCVGRVPAALCENTDWYIQQILFAHTEVNRIRLRIELLAGIMDMLSEAILKLEEGISELHYINQRYN